MHPARVLARANKAVWGDKVQGAREWGVCGRRIVPANPARGVCPSRLQGVTWEFMEKAQESYNPPPPQSTGTFFSEKDRPVADLRRLYAFFDVGLWGLRACSRQSGQARTNAKGSQMVSPATLAFELASRAPSGTTRRNAQRTPAVLGCREFGVYLDFYVFVSLCILCIYVYMIIHVFVMHLCIHACISVGMYMCICIFSRLPCKGTCVPILIVYQSGVALLGGRHVHLLSLKFAVFFEERSPHRSP